mgnify:CR=1 FL=1
MLRCDQLLSGCGDNGKIREGMEITMDSIIATQQNPDGVAQIQMPISISPDHLQPAGAASVDRLRLNADADRDARYGARGVDFKRSMFRGAVFRVDRVQ